MKRINLFAIALALVSTLSFSQTKWNLDKSHSKIGFSINHMVISEVEGQFHKYEAEIETDGEDFKTAAINIKIDVNSIDTENEKRDNHLKADDFFNSEKFPYITFVSKNIKKTDENYYKITGDFTIKDVTKEIVLDAKLNGIVNDSWGNTRAGFKLTGNINRFDYNLKWSQVLEAGGLVVGKDVTFQINVELIKSQNDS